MNSPSLLSLEKKIIILLNEFKQDKKDEYPSRIFNDYHKFPIEGSYDKNRLIRYVFKKFLNFEIWDRRVEKINWEIPFTYKGTNASLAHQKFGFSLYIDKQIKLREATVLKDEILGKTVYALKLIEPIIENEGTKSLKRGEIIVENKFKELENEFLYFLKGYEKRKITPIKYKTITRGHLSVSHPTNSPFEVRYLSDATILSFYSLLEHLCVLGLAFTDNSEKYDLESFSKKNWQGKFKSVFPLSVIDFNTYYNKLVDLAKYRRIPAAHGHLDKFYTIFHFYLEEANHKIPMSLYNKEIFTNSNENENLVWMNSFLQLLRKHTSTKRMMCYIDEGLSVSFEKQSLSDYLTYVKSDSNIAREYIHYNMRLTEDMTNMDW